MRKPIVVGNWKMNKTAEQSTLLIADLLPELKTIQKVDCVVCPVFTSLMVVAQMVNNTGIGVGAQDMNWESAGAYTGEVAPNMVKEFCQYVILGHSERRLYFGETDETVNKKVKAALAIGLTPIMCVGETIKENEAGMTAEVVERQLRKGLEGITTDQMGTVIIAYEPVWAIGTGRAATKEDAQRIIGAIIRKQLTILYGDDSAQRVRILYGGSVNGQNANEYFQMPDIDGALVGGASLKAPDFVSIARAAIK
jgi:triosephosphate isomerase (TIM)